MTAIARSSRILALAAALSLAACGDSSPTGTPPPTGAAAVSKGIVSAKGSITVNGVRFDLSQANVRIEDNPNRPESELKVGMVVKVKGTFDDRNGIASEVEAEDAVRGKITAETLGSIDVGGHRVEVDDSTEFEDNLLRLGSVAPGDRVKVHGLPMASGATRATRIEKEAGSSDDFEIKGFVSGLAAGPPAAFTLKVTPDAAGSYAVTLAGGVALPAGVANGSYVEVRSLAPPAGNAITASAVELEDAKLGEAGSEAEVEGIVTSGGSASFVVAGVTVVTGAGTVWDNGLPSDLVPGVKVEAEGSLDSQGALSAHKVSFRSNIRLQATPASVVAVDPHNGTFQMLGVTVHTSDHTEFKDSSGNPITLASLGAGPALVRGTLHRNGTDVVATRVELTSDDRPIVQGPVSSASAAGMTLSILGITVNAAAAEFRNQQDAPISSDAFFSAVQAGTVVKARGKDAAAFSGSTLAAKEVELEGSR